MFEVEGQLELANSIQEAVGVDGVRDDGELGPLDVGMEPCHQTRMGCPSDTTPPAGISSLSSSQPSKLIFGFTNTTTMLNLFVLIFKTHLSYDEKLRLVDDVDLVILRMQKGSDRLENGVQDDGQRTVQLLKLGRARSEQQRPTIRLAFERAKEAG